MSKNGELPKGWASVKLGEVCSPPQYGYTTSGSEAGDIKLLRTTDITSGAIDWNTVPFCRENPKDKAKYLLNDGDIVISRAGSVGISHLLKNPQESVFASYLIRFRPIDDIVVSEFLCHFLKSQSYWNEISEKSLGIAIPNVNASKLKEIGFPLPPLPEQHRIVSRIEELFSSLDKGIENLKTAQQQLKVYRQAVLKWAFEGNWKVDEFGNVAEIKRGKSKHRPRDAKELFGGPYPFIQTGEVRAANGGTINTYSQTYSETGLAQSKLWPKGTLCITIAANIAETAFLGFAACFPDSVVGIKVDENNLSIKFVNYYIQKLKQEINSKASATAQKNINVEFLERLPIPIPPLSEQHAIVSEIESRLSVCDKIEETIEHSLKQAEALRQSILKKAFEGRLVPQDPKDEPASVLLQRIKVERERDQLKNPPRRKTEKTKSKEAGA